MKLKRIIGLVLSLALVLGMLSGMSTTGYAAATYNVWVGGTQVTSANLTGTGWSYNAGTSTLTLNNYSYSGTGHGWTEEGSTNYALIHAKQDLTIELKGTNSIVNTQTGSSDKFAVYVEGTLSITGSGTLTANSGDDGYCCIICNDIAVENATVNATGKNGIFCNDITIESGMVNATGIDGYGIYAQNDIKINNGTVNAIGNSDNGSGIYAWSDIEINNGTVNATGADQDHYSTGIMSFTGSVTINNGTVIASSAGTKKGTGIVSHQKDVIIKGGNITANGPDYGIKSEEGSVTIEGGTVIAVGNNECGIMGMNGVTISDGTVTASGSAGIWGYMGISISGGDVTASGTEVGMTTSGVITVAENLVAKAGDSENDAEYVADMSTWEHSEKWVRIASHIHEFTYAAVGDTITVNCNADGCTLPVVDDKPTVTLTITLPSTDGGAAVLEVEPEGALGDLSGKIKYQTKNGSAWRSETTTAPTEAGIHRASITLGGKTASVTYGVNCITYATGLVNGSVSGATDAVCGATVTPTITPASGYQLDTLTVTPQAGSGIGTVTVDGGTFVMPEANVTVSATFKQITYTVTVDGGIAIVTDSTPEQNTYTAELTGLPSDKDYDGNKIALSATVQKSEGFPSQVAVGNVSFKFGDTPVDYAFNAGTYTATATVGDKTISKSFRIRGLEPITYEKTTKVGNSYLTEKIITDQYVLLKDNPFDITILTEGITYVARGNIVVGALVYEGNVRLIECEGSHIRALVGIYHIGSTLELYAKEGTKNSVLEVEGSKALTELNNNTGYTLEQIEGKGSSLSGNIYVYGGKLIASKGGNANLFADDIRLTIGAGLCAKGSTDVSEPAYFTGGYENSDGSVTYNKASLAGLTSVFIEKKTSATMTTVPVAKALIYNGTAQELVTAGEATGGTMQYALGDNATTAPDASAYTASIPTGTDAGTYFVWYKVVGDENHNNTEPACVPAELQKADPGKAVISTDNMSYDSSSIGLEGVAGQEYVIAPKGTEPDGNTWDNAVYPDAENDNWVISDELPAADEFEIFTRISETENYTASEPARALVNTTVEGVSVVSDSEMVGSTIKVVPEPEKEGYTYKWYRGVRKENDEGGYTYDLTEIEGVNGDSYTLPTDDAGKYIIIRIFTGESEVGDTEFGPVTYGSVSFDTKGGSEIASAGNLAYNAKISKPADPVKEGYTFAGWYKDEELTEVWDFDKDTVLEAETTLFAKWEKAEEDGSTGDSENGEENEPSANTGDDRDLRVLLAMMAAAAILTAVSYRKKKRA